MTPLQIQMMLHYYTRAEPYAAREPDHANSPAVFEQRRQLVDWDLLEFFSVEPTKYAPTERGLTYIQALMDMPLPIKKWVMPSAA